MSRLLIVGGGAAGMAAAVWAAERGMEVRVFEQNEKLGKSFLLPGRADAILPMPVLQRNCLMLLRQIPAFCTALFMDLPITM